MEPYQRYYKLFFNNQKKIFHGQYSMYMDPYVTEQGKLKFKNKKNTWMNIELEVDPLTEMNVCEHLFANCKYFLRDDDVNKAIADIKTEKVGEFTILKFDDYGVVVQPLAEDGSVTWAAIDYDLYNKPGELERVINQIYKEKLPITPCFSKSGGLHLYIFCKEQFTFDEITKVSKYFRSKLGITVKADEIFPKQPKTKTNWGNGIALPHRSTVVRFGKDGKKFKYNAYPNKNVFAKADFTNGTLEEFLDHAENNKIDHSIFETMPVQDIKEKKEKDSDKPQMPEPQLISSYTLRPPTKEIKEILNNIITGKEHHRGGTFDNHIVDLCYQGIVEDKRTDEEIREYFDDVKHKSEKANDDNYLKTKISNCRKKFNKPDLGPKINLFFKQTVWDCEFDKFYLTHKDKHVSDRSLNQIYSNLFSSKTTPTVEFYKNDENKQLVDACLYRPDLHDDNSRIIVDGQMTYLNKFVPNKLDALKPTEADLKPFFDLVTYLFPIEEERNHILDYLAHVIQKPGVKIKHAIMVYTPNQRVGKGSLFDTMTDILGERNCEPANVKSILDKGVMFSEKLLVLIDECKSTGEFSEKRNLVNDLKTILSETRIQKRVLYKDFGVTKTFTNFIIFTNEPDALTINSTDQRYFIVDNNAPPREQKFYDDYHKWRQNNGAAFVKYYLMHRDISKFNPNKPPPSTAAKERMAEETKDPLFDAMSNDFNEGNMPFPFDHSIRGTDEVSKYYLKHGSPKVKKFADNSKLIKRCFEKLGFKELGQVKHKLSGKKPSLWIVRNIENLKDVKNIDLCNEHWKPLSLLSDADVTQQRITDNFYKQVNSPENLERTLISLQNQKGQISKQNE